jgi:hypothetical protein
MASHSTYNWLWQPLHVEKLSQLLGCLESIHKGHVTVHQYKLIIASFLARLGCIDLYVFLYYLNCLYTVHCMLGKTRLCHSNTVLKDYSQGINVEYLVVNNKYQFLVRRIYTLGDKLVFSLSHGRSSHFSD